MLRGYSSLAAAGICLLVATGCGSNSGTASGTQSPPVSNLTTVESVQANPNFDAVTLDDKNAISKLTIVDENGQKVKLNSDTPILIEAYWCPHCQRTLVLLNSNKSSLKQLPILLSAGFPPNTTLQQAVAISKQEFQLLGISGFKVYYCLENIDTTVLPKFPTLLFPVGGNLEQLSGEHTLEVWSKALAGGN